jgi:RHS repeat-associated protein
MARGLRSAREPGSASAISYAPHDGVSSLTMGNSMAETWNYNSRLQPRQVSAVRSGTTHLQLGFFYCGSQVHTCSDNNGNLRIQTMGTPGQNWTQSYSYDNLNRLSGVSESGGSGWSQSFSYDAVGNRWVSAYTNLVPQPQTPLTSSWYNTTNNRLKSVGYDNAGNQTTLGAVTMSYDGESRMAEAVKSVVGQSWTTQYKYDGDGRRVKKVDAAGATTVYVYDARGDLAAEYYSGSVTATKGVDYLTADHLGSTRMIANESGTVTAKRDYQPFGEEIPSSMGGRPSLYDTQTEIRQQYTSKERDTETGLDYFGARYLSPVQGRFTGPDAPFADQWEKNPQSWNLYSYVRNNPLRFVDPSGRCSRTPGGGYTDEGEELFPGPCVNETIGGPGAGDSVTIAAKKGNAVGAFFLNAFFALDNAANDYFAWMFKERPKLLQNTPPTKEFVGQAAAGTVLVATMMIGPNGAAQAPLKLIHSEATLSKTILDGLRKKSTEEIINSLKPGLEEGLKVKPDGRVMDGNHRIKVLMERGVDVDVLPREVIE